MVVVVEVVNIVVVARVVVFWYDPVVSMNLYVYLLFLARGSGPDIALGLNSRKAATKIRPAKPANSSGPHQSWVHGGTLMYPPTCPPTRMLRQHVSQECTPSS